MPSGFGYQLLEMRDNGSLIDLVREPKSSNPTNMNGWKAITVEEFSTVKGDITSVTNAEPPIETVVNCSVEEIYTSPWDGERTCEDAIPSWRKTSLPEVARPASWNNGYESTVKSMVTGDPGNVWNLGQYGDHSQRDGMHSRGMVFFEGEKKMADNDDYRKSILLNDLQDFEMTTEIHSAGMLEIHSPTASIRSLRNSQEETKPLETRHMESFSTIKGSTIVQRDTSIYESGNEGELGGLTNLCTPDIFDDLGHEGSDPSRGGGQSWKDKDYATNNDGEKEQFQTRAHEFTTTTNIPTSMNTVGNTTFKRDSRSTWDPEENKINSQPNETSFGERTSLEPTEHVAIHSRDKESLTVNEKVVSHTKEDDEHVQEGTENQRSLYLGEEVINTRDESETEESLSQDTPSCKCLASLKHDLESLEESAQSGNELLMSSSGPRMDSQSEGEQHETVDSATEVPKNPTMTPETDNIQPLNLSAGSVDGRDSKHVKCEDDQHNTVSEISSKAAEEDQTKQATQGNEPGEMDATDEGLLLPVSCDAREAHELTNEVETNEVNQVVDMDFTSRVPIIPTESEETVSKRSPTVSISDGDSAQDPDKDLNKLMRCLGLTTDEQQKGSNNEGEKPSSQNFQNEDLRTLMHENAVPASGKMSGLPEMGEMLYKQEIQFREKAQKNLPDHLLQDSATEAQDPPGRVKVKGNKNFNLDSPQASSKQPGHDRHALETLRTSIVMRKQELSIDRETEKESPRLMDWMGGHKSHPTLALAIRNNRLVKLQTQDESQNGEKTQTPRSSFLNLRHVEATMNTTKSTQDEKKFGKETPRLIDKNEGIQHASENTLTPAPGGETHSSSEESIYQGDSFEEEEEEEESDQEPAYSEESCTNAAMRESSEQAPGLLGLETNERASPRSKPKVERSSANWEGESEQGSYSPDEDDTIADLPV